MTRHTQKLTSPRAGAIPASIDNLTNLKTLDLSFNDLSGASVVRGMPRHTRKLMSPHAGELPLAIGQLKANGCDINLYGNNGFTLSSDISTVKDATKLDFSDCYLSGACKGMTRHTLKKI